MAKLPFFPFYPLDWLRDTGGLSDKAKSVWIDILAYAWNEPTRGVYERSREAFCKQLRVDPADLLSILGQLTTVSVLTASDKIVTVKCRRMMKFDSERINHRNRQARYMQGRKNDAMLTVQTLDVRSQTLEEKKEKEEERERKDGTATRPRAIAQKPGAPTPGSIQDPNQDPLIQKQIAAQNYEAHVRAKLLARRAIEESLR